MHDFFAGFLTEDIFCFQWLWDAEWKKALKMSPRSTAGALEVKRAQCQNIESAVCLVFSTFLNTLKIALWGVLYSSDSLLPQSPSLNLLIKLIFMGGSWCWMVSFSQGCSPRVFILRTPLKVCETLSQLYKPNSVLHKCLVFILTLLTVL